MVPNKIVSSNKRIAVISLKQEINVTTNQKIDKKLWIQFVLACNKIKKEFFLDLSW
ncbi:hypothetical protein D3C80_1720800 [compost metagenome]